MKFKTYNRLIVVALVSCLCSPVGAGEQRPDLEGIFGLSDVGETTALAFWVPLDTGESVAGVSWFNSDGTTIFPEFLAVAGGPDHPELLSQTVAVGQNVTGETLGWSNHFFDQPLASSSSGIYLVLRLPTDSEYSEPGDGGGAGFGFTAGSGENRCWLTSDGQEWQALTVPHQAAIVALMNPEKSGDPLVLRPPTKDEAKVEPVDETPRRPSPFSLAAYPNPFNPTTKICFEVTKPGLVSASVFDLRGRLVADLLNEVFSPGQHDVTWNGMTVTNRPAPSGRYFVRVAQSGMQESISITLTK